MTLHEESQGKVVPSSNRGRGHYQQQLGNSQQRRGRSQGIDSRSDYAALPPRQHTGVYNAYIDAVAQSDARIDKAVSERPSLLPYEVLYEQTWKVRGKGGGFKIRLSTAFNSKP